MAKSKNNVVTHGLSGKVGDILVFSQRAGKTIVSKAPRQRSGEPSVKQQEQQDKFQEAVLYGKSVLADPALKKQYSDKAHADPDSGMSAYNVAVADLLNAPEIEEIDLSAYTGKTGDIIRISVTDDFKVKAVTVRIENPDGTLVEEGAATDEGLTWEYAATTANAGMNGDKIIIRATDNPNNMTEKTQDI